ncbi:E3 ubiquitin-protein ligase SHPRH [Adelges cooleyi]|uniref:E3 ubiquitin-protein ligase SHPRH n=1 Tax=Adelges cooleyi TaxID=133065 RepID=UPI00217F8C6B|nr:E3 ubiquitin-protein ligase SHPRH [Adelges cooleyi]XP_050424545.1 E3 ubiquitin-protein ligase SHPRH [Adelges cooleyi]XP_050424546.1 E3 ubiquitin-protein ligase SHPRH [Adelges cooleyi]
MFNSNAIEFFKNLKVYHENQDDYFQQPSKMIPTLRSYQRKAIKWMIDKEKNNNLCKSDGLPFSGGILADEMGLGKTVEMLACIIANSAPTEFYSQPIKVKEIPKVLTKPIKSVSVTPSATPSRKYVPYSRKLEDNAKSVSRSSLENWYKNVLDEMSFTSKKNIKTICNEENETVECYCAEAIPNSTLVYCAICGKGQHPQCVNFAPKPFEESPYLCADCWTINYKPRCKATLVVVPQTILNQWIEEIEKHVAKPGLKVLVYNGVHFDGYIQPVTFNDYDIVITSYSNLKRDLNFIQHDIQERTARLRHSKRYYYPQSPIPCIEWWRICLDEGQTVESTYSKVFDIVSCLKSVHKWAMTGTPIQKSLNDLYGLLKFLDVSPYCNHKQFLQLMKGETSEMYNWFSKVIWRNSMQDVISELGIPPLTTEQHWSTFSQIEKHFYQKQHTDCAELFLTLSSRLFQTFMIPLKNIDRRNLFKIMGPLLKLRQASVHPQAVRGQFLKVKGTMTMEKLMDVMIEKCRTECNEILRTLVSHHNGMAGLFLIRSQPANAVEHYRTVLSLMEKYKDKQLEVDTCQKIHVLYNLSLLLDEQVEVSHALNDLNLKENMEKLEKEYLEISKLNIENTRKTVAFYSDKVTELMNNGDKTLSYSNWWSDLLDWIYSVDDFLGKVQMDLEDYRVPGVPNIANRLKSLNDVYSTLYSWLDDLNSARIDSLTVLGKLQKTKMCDLVQSALICHLRIIKRRSAKQMCLLCEAENQLRLYETLLFSVSNKQKNAITDEDAEKSKSLFESTSKGLWKMSQKEFLLTKLFQYGQAKIINKNCFKDAAEHIKLLELVRKEFKYLRLLWTHLSDNLSAHDEIVMAKSRLRLEDADAELNDEGPPKKKSKKENDGNVISEELVGLHIFSLEVNIPVTQTALEKKIGTLIYLENLKTEKSNTTESELCPICCYTIENEWAVLQCGHCICNTCIPTVCSMSDGSNVPCPMCRSITDLTSISYVKSNPDDNPSGIVLKGSFSTKIESITLKLMELIAQENKIKVLIFSTWDKVLDLVGEALEQNSIKYRRLKSDKNYKKNLKDFKVNETINALLINLSLGSKGLNLTEATRIFFVEPVLNPADEEQAIGRIFRIGQTKPTVIHHFIIHDSIEENIFNYFSKNSQCLESWNEVTVAKLIRVFEKSGEN